MSSMSNLFEVLSSKNVFINSKNIRIIKAEKEQLEILNHFFEIAFSLKTKKENLPEHLWGNFKENLNEELVINIIDNSKFLIYKDLETCIKKFDSENFNPLKNILILKEKEYYYNEEMSNEVLFYNLFNIKKLKTAIIKDFVYHYDNFNNIAVINNLSFIAKLNFNLEINDYYIDYDIKNLLRLLKLNERHNVLNINNKIFDSLSKNNGFYWNDSLKFKICNFKDYLLSLKTQINDKVLLIEFLYSNEKYRKFVVEKICLNELINLEGNQSELITYKPIINVNLEIVMNNEIDPFDGETECTFKYLCETIKKYALGENDKLKEFFEVLDNIVQNKLYL